MDLKDRVDALVSLGQRMEDLSTDFWKEKMEQAGYHNGWFTAASVESALNGIRDKMLNRAKLEQWLSAYPQISQKTEAKKVGLILAGNIPLVGFHDILSVFIAGHQAMIKLSDKDTILPETLLTLLEEVEPKTSDLLLRSEKMVGIDAVIATGSNNSARYFESYFGKIPHIIRKNRNSIGLIFSDTNLNTIKLMGQDIFTYFGLGCRNVSKLLVPRGYDLTLIMEALHEYNEVNLHHKYKNNFDFNIAVNMLKKQHYLNNGSVMLCEDFSLASRIATLHFEYYENDDDLISKVKQHDGELQVVVSEKPLGFVKTVLPGCAQQPELWDYADEVDTMEFLINLS